MRFEIALLGLVDPRLPHEALGGVRPLTKWYNDRLGEAILRKPDQYWWVHRRWKGEPPQRARRLAKAA
jgi:KDO2-lipid IV(A) lauroyltransferase